MTEIEPFSEEMKELTMKILKALKWFANIGIQFNEFEYQTRRIKPVANTVYILLLVLAYL
jgi:hypothetical protein